MFRVQEIQSLDLPELQPYRTMRRSQEQRDQGIFVAEGEKVVRRLLESNFTVVSLVLPEKWVDFYRPLVEKRPEDISVYVADKKLLETLIGFSMYQGVLAVGKVPSPESLDQILSRTRAPRLLTAVDGLTSAENLGALVRNCVAFGVHALLVGETSSSPFLRRAVRNSMGTIFQLPVLESPSLFDTLKNVRARGIRLIAAHPHASGRIIAQADFKGDCCIVFGSEGHGISPAILELCNEAVAIPMPPTVDSLNVGAAAAVFLYEASQQRSNL
jgi:tRNA G18 (ribose-2'-O)-methylase SpoU